MDEMAIPASFSPKNISPNFEQNFELGPNDQFGQSPPFDPLAVEQNPPPPFEQNPADFEEAPVRQSPTTFEPISPDFCDTEVAAVTKSDDDSDDTLLISVTKEPVTSLESTGDWKKIRKSDGHLDYNKNDTRIIISICVVSPRSLYYKTSRIRNLREMDRYQSKLVTFVLDKYTLAWTNTLAYYGVRRLRIHNVFIVQAPGVESLSLMLRTNML